MANILDRAIKVISPRWAEGRERHRAVAETIADYRQNRPPARRRRSGVATRLEGRGPQKHLFASYRHGTPTRTQRDRTGYSGGPDTHLTLTERGDMMERSRDLERNNSVAKGMFDRVVDNAVSTGLTPQAQSGDHDWDQEAEEKFGYWADGNCDVRGVLDFWQMQRLGLRGVLRDGDVGFVMAGRQLQAVEADRIVSPHDVDQDNVAQGVEMDAAGRPVAYWVANQATRLSYVNKAEAERVPAKNFIHLMNPTRFNQTRGCPALGTCLGYFDQLDQYIEATLVGAQVAACVGGVILGDQRIDPHEAFREPEENEAGEDQGVIDMEPGSILNLSGVAKGEFKSVNPAQPPPQFPDFVSAILRFLGLSLGLPIELVSFNMQYASYSSGRMSLLQAYRTFRAHQQLLKSAFLRRVWRWKVSQFIKNKQLRMPPGGIKAAWAHTWQAPGWEWVDPEREAKAHALALDRGMSTLSEIAQEKGMDAQTLLTRRAQEIAWAQDLAKKHGLENWRDIARADTRQAGN